MAGDLDKRCSKSRFRYTSLKKGPIPDLGGVSRETAVRHEALSHRGGTP